MSNPDPNPEVIRENAQSIRENAEVIREQVENDRRWRVTRRWHSILTVTLIALVVTLAGLTFYGYPILTQHSLFLTGLAGVKPAVDTLTDKMKGDDTLLADLQTSQQDLRSQMQKISGELRSRVNAAGRQTGDSTAAMVRGITAGISEGLTALRSRVSNLETGRETDQSSIAGLQQELTEVRGQLEAQSRELLATQKQIDESAAKAERQLASLNDDQQRTRSDQRRDRSDVDRIANSLAMERVGFEVSKGHSQELAPGISLGLTKTDVLYHRADGWMWVMPDRRTIWLRRQSAQEPLTFYGLSDGRKRELVITQVTRNSVVGYLLVPKQAADANIASESPTPAPDTTVH
jgi:hypothetical protein